MMKDLANRNLKILISLDLAGFSVIFIYAIQFLLHCFIDHRTHLY